MATTEMDKAVLSAVRANLLKELARVNLTSLKVMQMLHIPMEDAAGVLCECLRGHADDIENGVTTVLDEHHTQAIVDNENRVFDAGK